MRAVEELGLIKELQLRMPELKGAQWTLEE